MDIFLLIYRAKWQDGRLIAKNYLMMKKHKILFRKSGKTVVLDQISVDLIKLLDNEVIDIYLDLLKNYHL